MSCFDREPHRLAGLALAAVLAGCGFGPALADDQAGRWPDGWHPHRPDQAPPQASGPAYRKGVVAVANPYAAEAGAQILERGGNAVDAAVAAAFASFIAEAGVVHLGGSGIAQLYDARTGLSRV